MKPEIVLCGISPDLVAAWRAAFAGVDGVEIVHGSILDQEWDGLVSPANSFGFMDGGIDLLYSRAFGWALQARVQQAIREKFSGELLVGQATAVPIDSARHLIVAPTMRVPRVINDYADVYLATRAAVRVAVEHGLRRVAMPGMGTGCGRVPLGEAAVRMQYGVVDGWTSAPFPATWVEAAQRHFGARAA